MPRPAPIVIGFLVAGALLHPTARAQAPPLTRSFAEARRIAATLPRLHSLVVNHRGQTVLEHYARGHSATRPANVKSASKSIISALTGIAIERGLIRNVERPIDAFFPEVLLALIGEQMVRPLGGTEQPADNDGPREY